MIRLQDQELPNLVLGETERLGFADKFQALNLLRTKDAKAPFRADRAFRQSLLLVEADGIDAETGLPGNITDFGHSGEHSGLTHTQNTVWSRLQSQGLKYATRHCE